MSGADIQSQRTYNNPRIVNLSEERQKSQWNRIIKEKTMEKAGKALADYGEKRPEVTEFDHFILENRLENPGVIITGPIQKPEQIDPVSVKGLVKTIFFERSLVNANRNTVPGVIQNKFYKAFYTIVRSFGRK